MAHHFNHLSPQKKVSSFSCTFIAHEILHLKLKSLLFVFSGKINLHFSYYPVKVSMEVVSHYLALQALLSSVLLSSRWAKIRDCEIGFRLSLHGVYSLPGEHALTGHRSSFQEKENIRFPREDATDAFILPIKWFRCHKNIKKVLFFIHCVLKKLSKLVNYLIKHQNCAIWIIEKHTMTIMVKGRWWARKHLRSMYFKGKILNKKVTWANLWPQAYTLSSVIKILKHGCCNVNNEDIKLSNGT